MAKLFIHVLDFPGGGHLGRTKHGEEMCLFPAGPLPLSPKSYYEQAYARRSGVFRETSDVKQEERR